MYDVQDREYDVQRSHSVTSQRSHPPTHAGHLFLETHPWG